MESFETVVTTHGGVELKAAMMRPAGDGPHPCVLVMSTAMGIGPLTLNAVQALANAGYLALATDMFGDGAGHGGDLDGATRSMTPFLTDPTLLRDRVLHWFELARTHPSIDPGRISAIGYCFGGQCALELARSGADVKTTVSYHGLLTTHARAAPGAVKGQVAIYTGRLDPYAPHDHVRQFRDEMIAADVHWHITEYGNSLHSFTDPDAKTVDMPGIEFDSLARDLSWVGTLTLLGRPL